jgi:hypothetical protein
MGTDIWFNVQVDDGPHDWLAHLPNFELINGDKWDEGFEIVRIEGATEPPYGTNVTMPGVYACSGEGRYGDEQNITAWAQSFTLMVRGSTVTVNTEWHADGYGEESNVYRDGQIVMPESTYNRQVPADLADRLAEAKRVLEDYDRGETPVSARAHINREYGIATALRKLAEGLSA